MATLSVRQIAQNCLGKTGNLSVNSDVYGYIFRDADGSVFGTLGGKRHLAGQRPADDPVAAPPPRDDLRRRDRPRAHPRRPRERLLSGATDRDDVTKVQYAVQVTRDLYAQVDVGIRRLNWQRIPLADAGGYVDIARRRRRPRT